jgi:hypothetical protein
MAFERMQRLLLGDSGWVRIYTGLLVGPSLARLL